MGGSNLKATSGGGSHPKLMGSCYNLALSPNKMMTECRQDKHLKEFLKLLSLYFIGTFNQVRALFTLCNIN